MLELHLLQFAHVLAFVYWLGVDTAAYYASSYAIDRALPAQTRITSIRILFALDLAPRACMVLILPLGFHLAWKLGLVVIPGTVIATIWLVCIAWLSMVLFLHYRHDSPKHGALSKFDFYFRVIMILALTAYAVLSLASDSGARVDWVAWKVLIFAAMISCGLMIRIELKPFGPAFARLLAGQANEQDNEAISSSISATRPWVLIIWLGLLISAWLGSSSI